MVSITTTNNEQSQVGSDGGELPLDLLKAMYENRLVIFAGAGVSMAPDANLPNFEALAKEIAGHHWREGTNELPRFLGQLQTKGFLVHERAAHYIKTLNAVPSQQLYGLLRCFPKPCPIRIVTTNFDQLFEKAALEIDLTSLTVHRFPNLPSAPLNQLGQWKLEGLVHIHGVVCDPCNMVLTEEDFANAYVKDGSVWRFLSFISSPSSFRRF